MRKTMKLLPVTKKLRLTEIYRRMFDVLSISSSLSVLQVLKNSRVRGRVLRQMAERGVSCSIMALDPASGQAVYSSPKIFPEER